jgi:hypothetical protein
MLQNEKGKTVIIVNDGYNVNDMILLTDEQKRLLDYLRENEIDVNDDITVVDESSDLKEI